MKIVITVPDGSLDNSIDYVWFVAQQVADGMTSGHHDAEHHWTTAQEQSVGPQWIHPMDGTPCESGPLVETETFCADHDRRVMLKEGS